MRSWRSRATSAAAVCLLLAAAGCGMDSGGGTTGAGASSDASTSGSAGASSSSSSSTSATPTHKPKKHYPTGPPMELSSVAPFNGATVGVAMPISMVFANPVKPSARKAIEQAITITTSTPVTGAWHWFGERRVDFRPRKFWKSGTTVKMVAAFKHVGDGYGRYGTGPVVRTFTIGDDVETHVYVAQHKTVVTKDGRVIRTMPSDAGSPSWPTWTGTMAVVNKEATVRMDSCSVNITCDKSNPNYYDLSLPWDVRLTWSGTFLHYSSADPAPGHANGSHGCVHLSLADAKWFYEISKPGDPVVVTGSSRPAADPDNGYAGFNLSWPDWVAGSANGSFTTHA